MWKNGVSWYNVTDGVDVDPETGVIEAGKEYRFWVSLIPAFDGATFNKNNPVTKINGETAETVKWYGDNNIVMAYTFTCPAASFTLSGTATSYLDSSVGATLMLFRKNTDMDMFVGYTVADSGTGAYQFTDVTAGTYRLTVLKNNHVPRDYAVTVSGNTTQDVKINPFGDVDGNGKVQSNDAMKAYQHAQGKANALLSGYAFLCADVAPVGSPNDKVQAADAMIIYQQAQGKHPLF